MCQLYQVCQVMYHSYLVTTYSTTSLLVFPNSLLTYGMVCEDMSVYPVGCLVQSALAINSI